MVVFDDRWGENDLLGSFKGTRGLICAFLQTINFSKLMGSGWSLFDHAFYLYLPPCPMPLFQYLPFLEFLIMARARRTPCARRWWRWTRTWCAESFSSKAFFYMFFILMYLFYNNYSPHEQVGTFDCHFSHGGYLHSWKTLQKFFYISIVFATEMAPKIAFNFSV